MIEMQGCVTLHLEVLDTVALSILDGPMGQGRVRMHWVLILWKNVCQKMFHESDTFLVYP